MRDTKGPSLIYRKYIATLSETYRSRQDVQIFIELLLTLSAVVVFSLFAIRPTLKTIGQLSQEINTKKETLDVMNTKIDNLQKAQSLYSIESTNLPLVFQAIPKNSSFPEMVLQLERVVKDSGASITNLTSDDVPLKGEDGSLEGAQKELSYTITLNGTYESLKKAQKNIESMRRSTFIDTGSFSVDESSQDLFLLLTISGHVPYLLPKQ